MWQAEQAVGVAANFPFTWQEAQAAFVCAPTKAKPVNVL
jgi:hypothetical protein